MFVLKGMHVVQFSNESCENVVQFSRSRKLQKVITVVSHEVVVSIEKL